MQTAPIIRYLRRVVAAHGDILLHPLELDGETIMCRDQQQAELIRRLFEAWTRDSAMSSNNWPNAREW